LLDFAADERSNARATDGVSCDLAASPSSRLRWSYRSPAAHPTLKMLSGRLHVPAVAVLVTTGGTKHRVVVVDRYFLAMFPWGTKTPTKITAIDAHGHVVARSRR
jgi:hypothetical protein